MKVRLPEKTKVHVAVPDVEVAPAAYVGSPRLVHSEQVADFEKDVEVLSSASPAQPSLKELLLADTPRAEIPILLRRRTPARA